MQIKLNSILNTLITLLFSTLLFAQQIPTPIEHFGFNIGDNYQLTTFDQAEAYFKKLDAASDKAIYTVIGKTEEGRDQFMLIVSSSGNLKKLEHYKSISQKLGNAEGLTDAQARALADEGKAVVWIDGGLHSTELASIHQLIETAYTLLSRNDEETKRILNDVIILLAHANPDGHDLVSHWYMRNNVPERRSAQNLPGLYQKYIGHDNNRDFYMLRMKESQNIANQLFIEWLPQIMYNHHQSGPAGSIVAGAPFRDPFNYVFDPLIITGLDAIGAAKQNRLNAEGKPGYTSKSGSVFSTWYNGGLRTTTYFHNIIGLLTEIVGSPNPSDIPLVTQRLIPNAATPNPIVPQKWYFRQTIDYSVSLNYATLDYASRYRNVLLYNIYKMGRNSIERGSKDYWPLSPSKVEIINSLIKDYQQKNRTDTTATGSPRPLGNVLSLKFYDSVMKNPELRDPRGYIIPADQPGLASAVDFLNALIRTGIVVQRATKEFEVNGKKYPENSYIVKTNQAFRPHVLDMFEPQDHPNDFQYPGGPPVAPYDASGWTLAFQMGFQFDRILDAFDGPFEKNPLGKLITLKGKIYGSASPKGYVLKAHSNNSFIAANQLLKEGVEVYRIKNEIAGSGFSAGSFYISASARIKTRLEKLTNELNIAVQGVSKQPSSLQKIAASRIALWDTYGGSMPSGWIRWIMEQFNYSFDVIYANDIDTGNLKSKYDVIVFVGGSIPGISAAATLSGRTGLPNPDSIPAEYRSKIGRITIQKSIPELKKFLEAGGNIVTIGSANNLAYHLKLPVSNALVEVVSGEEKVLPREKYYIPGSILNVNIDVSHPAAWGMNAKTDVYFDESPVFNIMPAALSSGEIKPLAWFDNSKPLRSGWALGQSYLANKVTAFVAKVGTGSLYAFGPEITFRAQPHGTFKLLFNQLYKNN